MYKVTLSSLQADVNQCLHISLKICPHHKKHAHMDFRQAMVLALVASATDAPRPQRKRPKVC